MEENKNEAPIINMGQKDEKLSYEQLKNALLQMEEQANLWKQKAYQEAGKISRISLLLECLKLQCSYIEFNKECFPEEANKIMANELIAILYPPKEEEETNTDNQ